MKFSEQLTERAFDARPAVAGKDARTLARDLLQMSQANFSAAFKHSPMKRAKLRGLQRNAVVVLGNVGTDADLPLPESMRQHDELLLREARGMAHHARATVSERRLTVSARPSAARSAGRP